MSSSFTIYTSVSLTHTPSKSKWRSCVAQPPPPTPRKKEKNPFSGDILSEGITSSSTCSLGAPFGDYSSVGLACFSTLLIWSFFLFR